MENKTTPVVIAQLAQSLPTLEKIIALNAPENLSPEKIKAIAMEEISYIQVAAMSKPDILKCDPVSVILAVKQTIRKNLTLDPSAGLVYMKTRKIKTDKGWSTILEITDTANGKVSLARQCGQILDLKRPVVKYKENGQVETVTVEFLVPSYPEPRWEVIEFGEVHFMKWRNASHKENSRMWTEDSGKAKPDLEKLNYANPNYTSWKGGIDPEFAGTKAIKHGLGKRGTNINEINAPRVKVERKDVIVIEPTKAINAEATETVNVTPTITSDDL